MADGDAVIVPAPDQQDGFMSYILKMGRFMLIFYFIGNLMKPWNNSTQKPLDAGYQGDLTGIASVDEPIYKDPSPVLKMMGGASEDKIPVFPSFDSLGRPLGPHQSLYQSNDSFDLRIFISERKELDFKNISLQPLFKQDNILNDWKKGGEDKMELEVNLTASASLRANQSSLFAHIYFTLREGNSRSEVPLDPSHLDYDSTKLFSKVVELVVYKIRPKKVNARLLMEDKAQVNSTVTESEKDSEQDVSLLPFWRPSLVVSLVMGMPSGFSRNQVPHSVLQNLEFVVVNGTNDGRYFYPVIYDDNFWIMTKHLIQINDTIEHLPLTIKYNHIPMWRWSGQTQMDMQNKMKAKMGMSKNNDGEADMIKELLMDTNPWLLGLTMFVSMLHMVFDTLAFRFTLYILNFFIHVLSCNIFCYKCYQE
jgi:hypothetical protein